MPMTFPWSFASSPDQVDWMPCLAQCWVSFSIRFFASASESVCATWKSILPIVVRTPSGSSGALPAPRELHPRRVRPTVAGQIGSEVDFLRRPERAHRPDLAEDRPFLEGPVVQPQYPHEVR